MANELIPGFFGKVPQVGDFVSRRLPPSFVKPWDIWLQEGLADSRKRLDASWQRLYLTGPVWRFVLGPGTCSDFGVAGILVPSVDRVGRNFPLTIAVLAQNPLLHLMLRAVQWFDHLENIAALLLKQKMTLKVFDQRLKQFTLPTVLVNNSHQVADGLLSPANDPLFLRMEMQRHHQMPELFDFLASHLLHRHLSTYSLWSTNGAGKGRPVLAVYRGLPPADRYVQFLASDGAPTVDS